MTLSEHVIRDRLANQTSTMSAAAVMFGGVILSSFGPIDGDIADAPSSPQIAVKSSVDSSYRSIDLAVPEVSIDKKIAGTLIKIHDVLIDSQTSLDEESAAVLYDNLWDLYS